ncbi:MULTISPECIES: hypothetical protein [Bacillus]|uniref:Uncharacterized protein n=3 Tax=Bacillus sonorensis TaxID=119858 RepID=M5PAA7_9BACI|nr:MULTISPECIES: hypothetical protein [Bacillus]EME72250.1 hypothetical protein BSONL12_23170 [Bacillus sonorensis L12]ASB89292.1 hypothetical protein S101395_02785 [Bacillus sonorensis]MCF7618582.1 hypothetical protein [Bacillus sonorensis]MCY7858803.1 hypothetical protein [Bacillus sonorensis]MCY8034123.1 hypothetical protein [Bacillus sonorensis]
MGIYIPFRADLGTIEFNGRFHPIVRIDGYHYGKRVFTYKDEEGYKELTFHPPEKSLLRQATE